MQDDIFSPSPFQYKTPFRKKTIKINPQGIIQKQVSKQLRVDDKKDYLEVPTSFQSTKNTFFLIGENKAGVEESQQKLLLTPFTPSSENSIQSQNSLGSSEEMMSREKEENAKTTFQTKQNTLSTENVQNLKDHKPLTNKQLSLQKSKSEAPAKFRDMMNGRRSRIFDLEQQSIEQKQKNNWVFTPDANFKIL